MMESKPAKLAPAPEAFPEMELSALNKLKLKLKLNLELVSSWKSVLTSSHPKGRPSELNHEVFRLFRSLHIHSGMGNLVTSLPALLVLRSGCPKASRCKSLIIWLNSDSGRESLMKYGIICLLFGVMYFLCPA